MTDTATRDRNGYAMHICWSAHKGHQALLGLLCPTIRKAFSLWNYKYKNMGCFKRDEVLQWERSAENGQTGREMVLMTKLEVILVAPQDQIALEFQILLANVLYFNSN